MRYSVLLTGPKNFILGAHVCESSVARVVIVLRLILVFLVKLRRFARINSFIAPNSISKFGHIHVLGPPFVQGTAGQQA